MSAALLSICDRKHVFTQIVRTSIEWVPTSGKQQIWIIELFCYYLSNYFELLLFADEDDLFPGVDIFVPPDQIITPLWELIMYAII